jgi:hypothetical protein
MKKIILMILGVLIFTTVSFAQNYYALVEIVIANKEGLNFIMSTITKTSSAKACGQVLSPIDYLKDQYQVRTECVSGEKWDRLLGDIFANQPTSFLYISYKDLDGYETRINSKVLTSSGGGAKVSRAIDPPVKETVLWAGAIMGVLDKGGIKNARIIYPRKSK